MNGARATVPEYPVTIIIPAYGAADQLAACLESLCLHVPNGCNIVVADDATPDDSIAHVVQVFLTRLPLLTYHRQPTNLGFVGNCNQAVAEVLHSGRDILLLNSDTEVTHGAIAELYDVLHAHEKHAAVTPRTNNGTIFTIPIGTVLPPEESFSIWQNMHAFLPRYHVMPTAVGFCMLIRNAVIREFGLFDDAYSPGYNEENDFICRVNKCGYSAIAANHAFVFHHDSSSFGPRKAALERRNRQHLDSQYPEFARKVSSYTQHYIDAVDHFAASWGRRRKRIVYDLSHLPAKHSGTSEVGLNVLMYLAPLLEREYDLTVSIRPEAARFFAPEIVGYQLMDPSAQTAPEIADLVFKPCHILDWADLYRMVRAGVRMAYTHLDIIAVRCEYISGPNYRELFRLAAEMADLVFTISSFSQTDFEAFYNCRARFQVVHLGSHEFHEPGVVAGSYILIVGNHFAHKAVDRAVVALAGAGHIVALGGASAAADGQANHDPSIRIMSSGSLKRSELSSLFEGAAVVVYPSFYEGFGLPVLDALAMGKRVVARDSAVNRELLTLSGHTSRLHLVPDLTAMRVTVEQLLDSPSLPAAHPPLRSWRDVAQEYAQHLTALLESEIDVPLLRKRWKTINTLQAYRPF